MADEQPDTRETLDDAVAEIDELLVDYELDDARQRLDEAVAEFGRVPQLRVLEAELALEAEDYEGCVELAEASLDAVDEAELRGRLLSLQGYALYYLDEIDRARTAFNRAVDADPELWTAIVGRAMVHDYLDFHQAALIDLDRAIELDDQEGQPFAIRGMIRIRFGQLDEARKDLAHAVHVSPWDEESRLNLARLQALEGESSLARETLEPLIDDGEDPAFVAPGALLRSQLALGLGSADAAAKDANRAIELLDDQPWGHLALAAARVTGGQAGEAIAALKDAEERADNPRDLPDLFALKASAYDQLGKTDKARAEKDRAEGSAKLPAFVYGEYLNPSRNVPVNPNRPVDVRTIMRQIFDDPDQAPDGYEDSLREVLDQIPEYVEQNPDLGRVEIELPQVEGMDRAPGNLVIQLKKNN
jgi:tetratricopeptide (TPR) repeat protein